MCNLRNESVQQSAAATVWHKRPRWRNKYFCEIVACFVFMRIVVGVATELFYIIWCLLLMLLRFVGDNYPVKELSIAVTDMVEDVCLLS